MEKADYIINEKVYNVSIDGSPQFRYGKDEVLSRENTDITFNQPWYEQGYTEVDFLDKQEFDDLTKGLKSSIEKIIQQELGISTEGFNLKNYHHYVTNFTDHLKIVSKTRDLFADDFNFPVMELLPRLEKILGFKLTDLDPKIGEKLHIIVRINRPQSTDYNPPHKDIYEGVDNLAHIPQFVNFWIPVAGVTDKSSLPLAPGSHRVNENRVLRTFDGGVVEGNKYRVRMIKSWGDNNTSLIRSTVKEGQVLIFSSHLIHGLAINDEPDTTRVALEFRLFKTA